MADITICVNDKCRLKDTCYRYKAKRGEWQAYCHFKEDTDKHKCEHLIKERR